MSLDLGRCPYCGAGPVTPDPGVDEDTLRLEAPAVCQCCGRAVPVQPIDGAWVRRRLALLDQGVAS